MESPRVSAVLVLGVHSADKSSTSSVAVETLPTDNVAAASSPAAAATATSSASVAANAKVTISGVVCWKIVKSHLLHGRIEVSSSSVRRFK